jgi:hypothetical protein
MYSDAMRRTQIYLDDNEAALLDQAAERTGASRSELIRRAVRTQYGAGTPEGRLADLRASAGVWSDRATTGADYVGGLREGLGKRLQQSGFR